MPDLVLAPRVPTPRRPVASEVAPDPSPTPQAVQGRVLYNVPFRPWYAITDPTQILAIALQIEHYRKPWWKRMGTPPPTPGTASRAQLGRACRGRVLLLSVRTAD